MNRFPPREQETMRLLEQRFADADAVQAETLRAILSRNKDTAFGKAHRFDTIRSADDYRACVGLTTYEDLAPYFERMYNGATDELVADPVLYWLLSSGTATGKKRLILTEEALRRFNSYVFYRPYDLIRDDSDGGCLFVGWFRHPVAGENTILSHAYHSYLQRHGRIPDDFFVGGNDTVFLQSSEGLLYFKSWIALASADVHDLLTVFLYDLILFLQYIEANWKTLLPAMLAGRVPSDVALPADLRRLLETRFPLSRARADFLAGELAKGPDRLVPRLWPACRFVNGIFGECFDAQKAILSRYIGDLPTVSFSYAASECIMGVPVALNASRYALLPESAYYEFSDSRGQVLSARDLTVGQIYEPVLTTFTGLYRYRLGDLVRFEGYRGQTPVITLAGRAMTISVAGEKVDLPALNQLVRQLLTEARQQDVEFSIGADESAYPCSYVVFFEGDPAVQNALSVRLDAALCENNPDYKDLRQMGLLEKAVVRAVPFGAHRDCIYKTTGLSHKKPIVRLKQPQIDYLKGIRSADDHEGND